jgi:hypothetical protein
VGGWDEVIGKEVERERRKGEAKKKRRERIREQL